MCKKLTLLTSGILEFWVKYEQLKKVLGKIKTISEEHGFSVDNIMLNTE